MRIEIRTSADEKRRWQEIAESKGVSLSDLVRSLLAGQRLRKRRDPPRVDPALRELARLGNNQPARPRCQPPRSDHGDGPAGPPDRDRPRAFSPAAGLQRARRRGAAWVLIKFTSGGRGGGTRSAPI